MSYEMALKKAGLPLVRSFLHSMEAVQPALPTSTIRHSRINFKLKNYKDGKTISVKNVETVEDSFPAKGDVK